MHIDLYRLKNESEIEEAGINAYYWEREAIVISEWTSMFPDFERAVMEKSTHTVWVVTLDIIEDEKRNLLIEMINKD